MKKFKKKPAIIEAVQWTGENIKEIIREIGLHESAKHMTWEEYKTLVRREGLKIFTAEGPLIAPVYHWIVKGYSEELGTHFWPVNPNYFVETYEPV